MTNIKAILGLIAAVISIICYIPYIITTIQGKTRPNVATWTTWMILSIVVTASSFAAGAFNTLWVPLCGVIGQGTIAFFAIKQGKGNWSKFDKICLFFVGLGLAFWWHFNSPVIALIMTLTVDLIGVLPTFQKSYREPESENLLTWVLYLLSSVFLIFSVERWSLALALFPIYLFAVNMTIVLLLVREKIYFKAFQI
jgi:hypothetical protein